MPAAILLAWNFQMEKTAGIEMNLEILNELERLSGCSLSSRRVSGGAYGGSRGTNPLHELGLFIKDEYSESDDEDEDTVLNEDGEEGEILS